MPLNYQKLMQRKYEPVRHQYTRKDTMLYALGLGVGSQDPTDLGELKFVYEKELQALPMLAVTLGVGRGDHDRDADYGITYTMLLHAEQSLVVHKPLPPEGKVISETKVDEVYDKGAKGAILYTTRRLYEETSGDLLITMPSSAFLRADGGFGGKSEGAPKPRPVPSDRPADLSADLPSTLNQALIYRLAGDYNPLHIDPAIAKIAGYDRPILHGLGAYGMAGRALIKVLCGNDAAKLKRLDVRFTSPVFPGEPLRIDVWKVGAGQASFKLVAAKRNVVVEDFGYCEYAG
jgi:acyl dehydratase